MNTSAKRIKGRAREFVETANWDVQVAAVFDKSKEVDEYIHGKWRKGCWKYTGRQGVWRGEDEEAVAVNDTIVEGGVKQL